MSLIGGGFFGWLLTFLFMSKKDREDTTLKKQKNADDKEEFLVDKYKEWTDSITKFSKNESKETLENMMY